MSHLPFTQYAEDARRAAGSAVSLSPTRPPRLLVVDDSRASARLIASTLREYGYEVLLAHSGEEALAVLATEALDCVLLDMIMPGLSGEETCRRIRVDPALVGVPVIIVTGREGDFTTEGIDAGADDYVVKSRDLRPLAARVRAQLRRRQLERESARIREELHREHLDATKLRDALELAEVRSALLADVDAKNRDLARANQELEAARARAERESRYKSSFLTMMSHELRTPLNSVMGFASILAEETLTPRQKSYVEFLAEGASELRTLVDRVLEFTELDTGSLTLRREHLSVQAVADTVPALVRVLAEPRAARVHVVVEEGVSTVFADVRRLEQILVNLLSNAIKFSAEGSATTVRAAADDAHVVFTVQDEGVGIAHEELPRVLAGFDQVGASVLNKAKGIGIGLVSSKRLVELHGGTLSIASELGRGTQVTVRLPIAAPPA